MQEYNAKIKSRGFLVRKWLIGRIFCGFWQEFQAESLGRKRAWSGQRKIKNLD
jgi:hypothetical protein